MPPKAAHHSLEIRDLRYKLALGVSAEERAVPQEVSISVTYRFATPPRAADNDDIRDTISYDDLSRALGGYFEDREYRLIERVATEAYNIARELARNSASVAVTVHKLHPPVANLVGGAAYTCGDFPP